MRNACPATRSCGIGPFGQIRNIRIAIEEQAMPLDLVYINGGQRGLQVRLSPRDAARLLQAKWAPLAT
jgi:Cys-tRNA(Pro)/Cys-tRNA(Cys) deacylase